MTAETPPPDAAYGAEPNPSGGDGPDPHPLVYDGRSGRLFGLGVRVALLTLVTLGVYTFWGRTRIRQYLWNRLTLLGDRIRYTGTGKELFLGFLIVIAVLGPLGIAFGVFDFVLRGYGVFAHAAYMAVQYILYLFLIGLAIFLARRYRLSRTVWRGIRFGQTGSTPRYALKFLGWSLLVFLTLGLLVPLMTVSLTRYEIDNTWFGNRHFRFDGRARELFGSWIFCWLLLPFTLGLSYFWYLIRVTIYTAEHSRFEGLSFSLPIRLRNAWGVLIPALLVNLLYGVAIYLAVRAVTPVGAPVSLTFQIVAGALFVFVMVFGRALVLALVTHRFIALVARRLTMEGTADFDSIVQSLQPRPGTGEGLASALDVGAGL